MPVWGGLGRRESGWGFHFLRSTPAIPPPPAPPGIYHPPGSLKATTCVSGAARLADYCAARGVGFACVGKVVVAPARADLPALAALAANAAACGVRLDRLSKADVAALEPALAAAGGLLSPGTAIFDSHAYVEALLADFEAAGGTFVPRSTVVGGRTLAGGGLEVRVAGSDAGPPTTVRAASAVLAAGLGSNVLLDAIDGLASAGLPRQRLAAGRYFALAARPPFRRLVYPLPVQGGLGVHATLDLSGRCRFGPDVAWVEAGGGAPRLGPSPPAVPPALGSAFEAAIRRWWPGLPRDSLVPDYAGLRPKLGGPGDPPADFVVAGRSTHAARAVVAMLGIESPGLTASLALADVAVAALDE